MKSFGKVSYDAPASISIYADSFEDKDAISECIKNYNSGAEEKIKLPIQTMWLCSQAP